MVTTKFLHGDRAKNITGIDISKAMIHAAQTLFPEIKFETVNVLDLDYDSNHFGSAIAFYTIVHFTRDEIKSAFREVNSVLRKEGQFLFSFHVGDQTVHFEKAGDKEVDIDLYFFPVDEIISLITDAGFRVIDVVETYPYEGTEYSSKRG